MNSKYAFSPKPTPLDSQMRPLYFFNPNDPIEAMLMSAQDYNNLKGKHSRTSCVQIDSAYDEHSLAFNIQNLMTSSTPVQFWKFSKR
ncbi:hypothetical protein FGO68_gene11955 [Halteria grandinella]|uniref:Uncharacterized protein n=1 Tax=Halteria grandinella TaxID=5974 RepID=A0A8J8NRS1_HALGN|nr:hypothetical protein FGO68_gene11955 [Halteria grandinella]